jgi:hypothetical protein
MQKKSFFIIMAVCFLTIFLQVSNSYAFSKGINCGGMPYTAKDGKKFTADIEYNEQLKAGYIGGNKGATDAFIINTEDQALFKTDRWGFEEYRFDVPNGVYKVSLYVAETHFDESAQRVFDIYIEDKLVDEDLDLIQEYGKNQAAVISYMVHVTDEQLNIEAEASADLPKLCAIYIEDMPKDDKAPGIPAINKVITHDGAIGLIWLKNPEIDIAGYNVYRKLAKQKAGEFNKINKEIIKTTAYIDKSLDNGISYAYKISAVDVFDNESDLSVEVIGAPREKMPEELILRINCGGQAVEIEKGCGFVSDIKYNPAVGYGYDGGVEIIGEAIDKLPVYASMREGFTEYRYDVPNGIYKIMLCFVEPEYDREAKRLFNIYIEDKLVLEDFDVYKQSRDYGFTVKEFISRIEDGQLNLKADKRFGLPVITYLVVAPQESDAVAPPAVGGLKADAREDRVFVLWENNQDEDVIGYNIYRSQNRRKGFEKLNELLIGLNSFRDNEVDLDNTYYYKVSAVDASLNESALSEVIKVKVRKLSNDEFLDLVQRASFEFFWQEADQHTGFVKDRSDTDIVSTASIGFGLSAMVVGAERGYKDREAIEERVYRTLKELNQGPRKFGLYFHYVDFDGNISETGYEKVISTIDSGILLMGVITAGEYFGGRIKEEADKMIEDADWNSVLDRGRDMIFMAWAPDDPNNIKGQGQYHGAWDYYTDEAIICSLLGIAAPNDDYRIPPTAFYKWKRAWGKYIPQSKDLEPTDDFVYSWSGCTFTYQFAHCWIDFSKLGKDQPKEHDLRCSAVDWHKNTIEAMKAARRYCVDRKGKFETFSENSWGLTACASKNGYLVVGAMPKGDMHDNPGDGTIAPYGAGCALPFLPEESLAALKYYYSLKDEDGSRLVWQDEYEGGFGFWDSFNLDTDYVSKLVIGIDQGPLILAIENYRSGLIWKYFMKNKNIQEALRRIKFEKFN